MEIAAFLGSFLLWAGALMQMNSSFASKREFVADTLSPLNQLTGEETEKLRKQNPFKWLLLPFYANRRWNETTKVVRSEVLKPSEIAKIKLYDREIRGWAVLVVGSIMAASATFGNLLYWGSGQLSQLPGNIAFWVLMFATMVWLFVQQRRDYLSFDSLTDKDPART